MDDLKKAVETLKDLKHEVHKGKYVNSNFVEVLWQASCRFTK